MKRGIAAALFGLAGLESLAAQNLIPDPTFSSGVSGWAVRAPDFTTRVDWNSGPGADGAPGFASMVGFRGPGPAFATLCLPVEAGTIYAWGGFLRQPMPSSTEATSRNRIWPSGVRLTMMSPTSLMESISAGLSKQIGIV